MELDQTGGQVDVRRVAARFWRRKWWVVVPAVVAVNLSLLSSLRQDSVYRASAQARYADPSEVSVFGFSSGRFVDPVRQATTEVIAAQSTDVRNKVAEELGVLAASVRSLRVSAAEEAQILSFEATSTSPRAAQQAASIYARVYVEHRRRTIEQTITAKASELRTFAEVTAKKVAEFDAQVRELDDQIARAIPGTLNEATAEQRARHTALQSERQLLANQRQSLIGNQEQARTRADQLNIEASIQAGASADVIQTASLPTSPFSPTPRQDALVAAVIGLVLGLGLAYGRDFLDDRVHSPEDVADVLPNASILGSALAAPTKAKDTVVTLVDQRSADAEAYRSIRTSIQYAAVRRPLRTLLVTSAVQSEGKTTTAANLAASLASTGACVAAVDFDLRRPRLAGLFGAADKVGLTSVLLGEASLDDAVVEVPTTGSGRLLLLPAGPLPPNPTELLGAPSVGALLETLRQTVDYLILDTPPMLLVSDALVAGQWADAMIVVTRVGLTRRRHLHAAERRLDQTNTELLGLVVNGVAPAAHAYGSGYYGQATDQGDARGRSTIAPTTPAATGDLPASRAPTETSAAPLTEVPESAGPAEDNGKSDADVAVTPVWFGTSET